MHSRAVRLETLGLASRGNRHAAFLLTGLALGLCLLSAAALAQDDGTQMREWTSASGAKITARFETFEDGQVVLVTEDRRRLAIAPADLSEADAKLAAGLAAKLAPATPAVKVETGPNKLPLFTSGDFAGSHAVYQHALLDTVVDVNGRVLIYPKHDGQRVGKPLSMGLSTYYSPPGGRTAGRPIVRFEEPPAASRQPSQISLRGVLKDDVPFELHYRFEGGRVTAWGWCEDPQDLRFPTRYRLYVNVPASHAIPPTASQEERERMVAGYMLHLREQQARGARWVEYNYHQAISFPRAAREARLETRLWAPRVIKIETRHRDLPLRPYIYSGRSLWQGYSMYLNKSDTASKQPSESISVIVE